MTSWAIRLGEALELLAALDEASVDACVTDPPYGIGFMGREWDTFTPGAQRESKRAAWAGGARPEKGSARERNPNLRGRSRSPATSPSQIEYDRSLAGQHTFQAWCEAWALEVRRVLKPGGHLISFAAPRSGHRLVSGVEDAGFEIRDCLQWMFGQGFPKSHNIADAIDKADRGFPHGGPDPTSPNHGTFKPGSSGAGPTNWRALDRHPDRADLRSSDPRTRSKEAQRWVGWGSALKPAYEPIVLARKPLAGTLVENVRRWDTGAINIDGCRIEASGRVSIGNHAPRPNGDAASSYELGSGFHVGLTDVGRWPANVILDEEAAAQLDEQTGDLGISSGNETSGEAHPHGIYGSRIKEGRDQIGYLDRGGASRFFYCAKPSRAERDLGCASLRALTPGECTDRVQGSAGITPYAGAGRSGGGRNFHPTVKPLALMRWLVRLVTPPGGLVLDPFAGSGTTGMACVAEGLRFLGFEREQTFIEIACRRILAAQQTIVPPRPPLLALLDQED